MLEAAATDKVESRQPMSKREAHQTPTGTEPGVPEDLLGRQVGDVDGINGGCGHQPIESVRQGSRFGSSGLGRWNPLSSTCSGSS